MRQNSGGFHDKPSRTYTEDVAIAASYSAAVRWGNSPLESAGAPAAAAAQSKAQARKPNACLLVDREDMERLAKGKVTLLHNIEAAEQTNCEVYLDGKSDRAVIVLEVHWTRWQGAGAVREARSWIVDTALGRHAR